MILLDTNVCVGILRGDRNVLSAYAKNAGNVAMSALTLSSPLATGNTRHFVRFPDLELANWFTS